MTPTALVETPDQFRDRVKLRLRAFANGEPVEPEKNFSFADAEDEAVLGKRMMFPRKLAAAVGGTPTEDETFLEHAIND